LFDERLKKQIIKENEIEWINFEDSKNPTKVECVIHRVITIRNNLFHGAKNTEHIGVNKKRDEKLLLYSIKAIQELVKLEGDVKYNFYKIENYRVINIKTKFFKAIKDAMIIIFIILLITTLLDYMNLNINLNQFGNKIGDLGLINIYENKNLNGLLSLGFILAGLSFIYDMFFKKAKTEVEENGRKT